MTQRGFDHRRGYAAAAGAAGAVLVWGLAYLPSSRLGVRGAVPYGLPVRTSPVAIPVARAGQHAAMMGPFLLIQAGRVSSSTIVLVRRVAAAPCSRPPNPDLPIFASVHAAAPGRKLSLFLIVAFTSRRSSPRSSLQ